MRSSAPRKSCVAYMTTRKVVELVRVSTQGQAGEDRASIPAQRAINERTARAYGLEIVDLIELVNVSGASVLRTPEMQRLLKIIENPTIEGVVVREFSRVMRPDNFADYVLLQTFQDTGTVLYLPDGPIDFSSKTGRLMGSIRAAIAGLERTEILERVWGAKEEKRRNGKHPHGAITLPFGVGYDRVTERWFYKPEVEKVCEAVRLFLSGQTSYKEVGSKIGIDAFNLRVVILPPRESAQAKTVAKEIGRK
jgi:DNA invertase Pin-like site-specific DNA recombinase